VKIDFVSDCRDILLRRRRWILYEKPDFDRIESRFDLLPMSIRSTQGLTGRQVAVPDNFCRYRVARDVVLRSRRLIGRHVRGIAGTLDPDLVDA
jgi:hypothetical protein